MSSLNILRSPRTGPPRPGDPRPWPFASKSPPPIDRPQREGPGREPPERERPQWAPAAACGVLVLALALQVVLPYGERLPQTSALAPRRPRPVVVPPVAEYPVILQSPIFSPDRKPGEDLGAAPGASALDSYAALGVAMGHGFASALVKGPGGPAKTIGRGQTLEGWRLVAMDKEKLTFERGSARHVLTVGAPPVPAAGQSGTQP